MKVGPGRWRVAAAMLAAMAAGRASAAPTAPPVVARYEAYVLGFPVVDFAFRLDESGNAYVLGGKVKTVGLLRLIYRFDMRTQSQGTIAADRLRPQRHEQLLQIRGHDRMAQLDYPGDGAVRTALIPPEDPGRPRPTPQQTAHTLDPLSALLAIGRSVAAAHRCAGRFAVYDGRRRYDLVLGDEGTKLLGKSAAYAYAGEVRRCSVAAVKIAGFSWDQDYSPHTTKGSVWFASPQPGAPALPVRIEFGSSWGGVSVRLTGLGKDAEN
jgi:hypothetical protein